MDCRHCRHCCCNSSSSFRLSSPPEQSVSKSQPLRLVLLGKTGVGKSAVGNTILGRKEFLSNSSPYSVTPYCQKSVVYKPREIHVIDTPGMLNTTHPRELIKREIVKCIQVSAPGPHVFLLVIQIGRFTIEEQRAVQDLQELFGEEASTYMIVLFTHGDALKQRGQTIEEYIETCHPELRKVIQSCGGRYVVFDNRNTRSRAQVKQLIEKIDQMVSVNGGECFTQEMFQEAEEKIRQQKASREVADLMEYQFSFLGDLDNRVALFQRILLEGIREQLDIKDGVSKKT